MMKFRLGFWYLRANDLKSKSTNIPRLCLRLRNMNLVEDEEHVVFECPSFECVRNKYRDLFLKQTKLIQFMNTKKQGKLASFLWKLMW